MSLTINIHIYSNKGHVDNQSSPVANGHSVSNRPAYVTKVKPSEPTATRNKNKELLQKHGFDVLGQSFGIPSRIDYEREGPMTTPPKQAFRHRSPSLSPSDQGIEVYLDDNSSPAIKLKPAAHGKRISPPSSSEKQVRRKPGQTAMYPGNSRPSTSAAKQGHHQRPRSMSQSTSSSSARESREQVVLYKSDDDEEDTSSENTQSSTSFYLPPPPPQPHLPRQESMACYSTHPAMAGHPLVVYPMANTGYNTAHGPIFTPFSGLYYSQPQPQCAHVVSSGMYPQGFTTNHPGALPMPMGLPQQQHMNPATYMLPMTNFATGPASPPPPPPPAHQANEAPCDDVKVDAGTGKTVFAQTDESAHENNPSNGGQNDHTPLEPSPEPSTEQKCKTPAERSLEYPGKTAAAQVDEEPLSFPYKHLCAGCGKKRSNGYHMTHCLKDGETAGADYCRRCVAAAAFTDSEAPSMDGRSRIYVPYVSFLLSVFRSLFIWLTYSKATQSSSRSSGADSQIRKGHYVFDDRSRRHKLHNRPRRRSFLKSFLHYSTRDTHNGENRSLSSAEEASSRASSHKPGHNVRRKPSHVSTDRSSHKTRNATPVAETSASEQRSRSDTHTFDFATKLSSTHNSYNDEKENCFEHQKLPQIRVEASTVSATNSGRATPARKKMKYKQPTVRNEASELANKFFDSSAPDDHSEIPTRSSEDPAPTSSHISAKRSDFSGIQEPPRATLSSPQCPDENAFPELRYPLRGEEANAFDMYDSSPRDLYGGFGSFPPTPTDPTSSNHFAHPHIADDSWEFDQSRCEKMAEEMAEEELMRAGKRSGLFDSSKSSSTASSNPFFRNLTPSLISIESCPSDEERTDGNDHYELATAADGSDEEEEDTTASKENPKQLG